MAETVLITGATGFIGRGLAGRLINAGLKVRCLARGGSNTSALEEMGCDIVRGDLLDRRALERAAAGVTTVWHLGALVRPKTTFACRKKLAERFYAINALGTENLARASAAAGVKRFIYFSTIAALGPGDDLDGEAEPGPLTLYGRSKLAGEILLRKAAAETGLDFLILRPAMIYGPGAERWESLVGLVKRGFIALPGNGGCKLSVCWLESLLDAALLAARASAGGSVLNISEGSIKVNDLLAMLAECSGVKPVYLSVPRGLCGGAVKLADLALGALGLSMPRLNFLADYSYFKEACSDWSHDTSELRALGWKPPETREAFKRSGLI